MSAPTLPPIAEPRPARATARLVGPDVTRAIAIVGVMVMNYHGYLNGIGAASGPQSSLAERVFDPWTGVLSTRFAATFVLMAGVGVTLLTDRARLARLDAPSGAADAAAMVSAARWRLIRRGIGLYLFGLILDWIWPGTILFFYGAMFVVAAVLFTWRTRWIIVTGAVAAVAGAGIHWWAMRRSLDGDHPSWLLDPRTLVTRSPRGLLLDTFVNGTHPLLPWLAFLCAGIVLGRFLGRVRPWWLVGGGATATAVTYLVNHVGTNGHANDYLRVTVLSTQPFERGLLYTIGTLGSSLAAFGVVSWVVDRRPDQWLVRTLADAGQMTLTIYVLHVAVFNVVVSQREWVRPTGLDTALVLAFGVAAASLVLAAAWRRLVGRGPLEVVYRRFGG
jgi:uncharacterized membrane protein YeiB